MAALAGRFAGQAMQALGYGMMGMASAGQAAGNAASSVWNTPINSNVDLS